MTQNSDGKRIAITGGIGAGKSTVCARLRQLGATVISADAISREVVNPGEEGLIRLTQRYGADILQQDGTLNRAALASIIFESGQERAAVNAILHPLMQARMLDKEAAFRSQYRDAPLFFEIPLLYEAGMEKGFDEVWLVTADEAVRTARIQQRDRLSPAGAMARIQSQLPQWEKEEKAHRLFDNSGDVNAILAKVDAVYAEISREI